MDSTRISVAVPGPSSVTTSSASRIGGKHSTTSAVRTAKNSARPRNQPASSPSTVPTKQATAADAKATVSEVRAPQMMRESTSRPNSSRPSMLPGSQAARRFATSWRTGSGSGRMGAAMAASTISATAPPGSHRRFKTG